MPKAVIIASLAILAADSVYRITNNISYATRQKCFVYRMLPRPLFYIYENFVELWLVMVFGIVCAVLLERYFAKYKRFYPRSPLAAFIYGAILPVCSCSTIPILGTLQDKMRFRTIVTFAIAAPLLSPTIISLSFSVLGVKYGVLRIVCSFILAYGAGLVLEFFRKPGDGSSGTLAAGCDPKNCHAAGTGVFDTTWRIATRLIPYILIAGVLSTGMDLAEREVLRYLKTMVTAWYGKIMAVVIGVPLYVCNGADIFMLRPMFNHLNISHGTALAFSLSGSAVCVASIVMLARFIGKKLTAILTAYVTVVCLAFSFLIG